MEDFLFTPIVFVLAGVIVAALARGALGYEARLLWWGFAAHGAASFAQVWIVRYYYGFGDMLAYWEQGSVVADLMRSDVGRWAPEYFKLFFHLESQIPFGFMGGLTTNSLGVLASFCLLALGNSLYATAAAFGMGAFLGKVVTYRALRDSFPQAFRPTLMGAILLLPSAVFWSSGIIKEAAVIMFLGVAIWGVKALVRDSNWIQGLTALALSLPPIAMIKAYVIFPLLLAAGAWFYWQRVTSAGRVVALKPFSMVVAAAMAVGGVLVAGRLFPEYSVENMGRQTAEMQARGTTVEGGTNYSLGASEEPASLVGQAAFLPLALVTALFRPFIFEARNALVLISSLETTYLIYLAVRVLRRRGFKAVRQEITGSPILVFVAVNVAVFSASVGLASTNLGSLSRYRAPFWPFWAVLLLYLARDERRGAAASPAPAPAPESELGRRV